MYRWDPATSSYQLITSLRFFYDGWNLIGQVDEVTDERMSFLWGPDLSGSLQSAGGVGGLLAVSDSSTINSQPSTHFVAHDGNGNVAALVNANDGTTSASYEYGPFGETLRATGLMAAANPFRFSTKYQDNEIDLLYYGYRYYSASTGRWLGKDPLEELGGANLYGFVFNSPTIYFDVNGDYTLGEWAQIGGAYYEGLGIGAANVGKAAWGLIKSPYTITKSLSEGVGHLSTQYGRQRLGEQLYLASQLVERFRRDDCFRQRALALLGDEAKIYFTDPYKLSELFAEIGVAAATAGAGAWAESANGAEKLAKLARLLEEFMPKNGAGRGVAWGNNLDLGSRTLPSGGYQTLLNLEGRTVFSGHGTYDFGNGFFRVPEGTSLRVYSRIGEGIYDDLGNAIELGADLTGISSKLYRSGDLVPNLTLRPGPDLDIINMPWVRTVGNPTPLQSLLKANMGECHWGACQILNKTTKPLLP